MRAKLLLVIGSVAFALGLVEFAVFPLLLPHTPLRLHIFLPEGVRVLAQSSKAQRVPERYVALAGDSYAQGRGDWLLGQDANRNGHFHSAHVLHERTGRDVLSFGRGGTGAVRGAVEVIAKARYLGAASRIRLPGPELILFYFYEGNDLQDTLFELLFLYDDALRGDTRSLQGFSDILHKSLEDEPHYYRRALEHPEFGDRTGLRRRIRERLLDRHPLVLRTADPPLGDSLHGLRTLSSLLGARLGGRPAGSPEEDVFPLQRQRPKSIEPIHYLRVRGQEVPLTVELQGPATELDEEETDAALWALGISLELLAEELSGTRVCLVYIPSPAATYQSVGETLVTQVVGRRPHEVPTREISARSELLRRRVGEVAAQVGVDYLDVTPAAQRNGRQQLLHGPTDVRHFNELGYTLLGNVASRCIHTAS